jgi:hypothetical protein
MRAELFIDPACPWTWVTSRWLCEVREHRPVTVRWRPFSLLLDDTLADIPLGRRLELAGSARVLRLMEAIRARYGDAPIDEFYTRVGTGFHHDGCRDFEHVESVLVAMDIDTAMMRHLDDPRWDRVLEDAIADAHSVAGSEAGVPLLVMEGDGPRRAFLGPAVLARTDRPRRAQRLGRVGHAHRSSRLLRAEAGPRGRASASRPTRHGGDHGGHPTQVRRLS